MSNAVSEDNPDVGTGLGEEDPIEPAVEPDNNSRNIKETKEDVIVPEVVEKEEPAETNLVPLPDIAPTTKKKSTLSKVGKGLASIIASI